MRFYCAGDDCGGVSLWRIFPRTAPAPSVPPPATHHTRDRNRDRDWDRDRDRDVHRGRNQEESKESGFTGEDIDNGHDSDIDNGDDGDGDEDENENDSGSSITVGSVLQCFLNVNCLPRLSHISEDRSCEDTGERERNDEEKMQDKVKVKDERIVTLQFLPNSELLLVGTNRRLLLIVVGAMQDPGPSSGICGDVWNVSTLDPYRAGTSTITGSDVFSPSARAREQSLSHWLSQSPSPYKRQNTNKNIDMNMNMNISKESESSFVSWVELDHVPPHCEGIFSMSVGSESGQFGGVSGTEQGQGQGQGQGLELGKEQEQEQEQQIEQEHEQEMSIFLWKVIVQSEVPSLEREGSKSSSLSEVQLTPRQPDDGVTPAVTATATATAEKSKVKPVTNKSEKSKGGALFSLPSFFSSTAQQSAKSNNVPVSATAQVPAPLPVPVLALALSVPDNVNVTPKKQALNLNLKEEKETPCCVHADASSRDNSTNKRLGNFDAEGDDDSDCRVYRLKWSEEMFLSAFKNLRSIPQMALEDHLTKIF